MILFKFLNLIIESQTEIRFDNNIFKRNKAALEGGSIKWNQKMPKIEGNNIFQNNDALYGSDIASYPIRNRIQLIINNSFVTTKNSVNLANIASGSTIETKIQFELIDVYNNVVKTANKLLTTLL